MKTYIEYYHKSAISDDLISACGDRSIMRLDSRLSLETHISCGHYWSNIGRSYPAFKVLKGESLLRAKPVTELIMVKRHETI